MPKAKTSKLWLVMVNISYNGMRRKVHGMPFGDNCLAGLSLNSSAIEPNK